jgi:hypothetical protein
MSLCVGVRRGVHGGLRGGVTVRTLDALGLCPDGVAVSSRAIEPMLIR